MTAHGSAAHSISRLMFIGPVHRVSGRTLGRASRPGHCGDRLYSYQLSSAARPHLQHVDRWSGLGWAHVGNVLPSHAVLRPPQHPDPLPSLHARPLRKFCRRRRQHSANDVRMVPRPPFLPLDVLERGGADTDHAVVHLSRNSPKSARRKTRPASKLRRISLRQRRLRPTLRRPRSGPAPRLVAFRIVQRTLFLRRHSFCASRSFDACANPTRS